ncbi:hypothetical protein FQR65_LT19395 [Abscondita terminalis]|nr:hypothetical protein FQR65_LT19395 [Abscondita terminalis]
MSLWSDAQKDSEWQNWWTAFYWLWWPTWAPFVGMFIAKISKGRTIRQLISGVLIVPTLVTFFWFAVFGGSALKIEQDVRKSFEQHTALIENQKVPSTDTIASQASAITPTVVEFQGGPIVKATQQDNTLAIFELFNAIDSGLFGSILSIANLSVIDYLSHTRSERITDSHSNHLVSNSLSRISLGLLYAGGLKTIQAAVILFGFPIIVFLTSLHDCP